MLGNRPATDRAVTCDRGHTHFTQDNANTFSGCATCDDLSLASDLYKDATGTRPHCLSERALLAWLVRS